MYTGARLPRCTPTSSPPTSLNYGSEEQKQHWLPRMATGEMITAIAMTEPGTGSDLQAIRTTARARRQRATSSTARRPSSPTASIADLVIVAAKTDTDAAGAKGVSLMLVETDRPGFKRGRNLEEDRAERAGHRGAVLRGRARAARQYPGRGGPRLRLPDEPAAARAPAGRASAPSPSMEAALAMDPRLHASERKAFGKPIAEFQNTRFKLAEVKTEVTVARVFLDHCLRAVPGRRARRRPRPPWRKCWLTELRRQGARHLPAAVRRLRLHAGVPDRARLRRRPRAAASTPAPPRS